MKLKSILFIGLCWLVSMTVFAQTISYATHEVKVGETFYSLSKKYGVTIDDIKKINPSLQDKLIAGKVIYIPALVTQEVKCRLMYKIKKNDTVYSLCKKYGINEAEFYAANPKLELKNGKLKRKQEVCIPFQSEKVKVKPVEEKVEEVFVEPMKIAFILPFNLDRKDYTTINLKMLDFYEGFLLAVDELRLDGLFADIYAYDETQYDSLGLNKLLSKPELKNMDIIVGPYNSAHLPKIIEFAQTNSINIIVPFSSKENYAALGNKVFQLNAPQAAFYGKVYDTFIRNNADNNIVFLHTNERGDNEAYYSGFKAALSAKGINYNVIDVQSLEEKLMPLLDNDKKNVIVSVSATEGAFKRMVHSFDRIPGLGTKNVSVFGLPNWLQFAELQKDNFIKYNCSFFTRFLYDETSQGVKRFQQKFQQSFNRVQCKSFPMYGVMGFDLGMYFLTGYYRHSDKFFDNVNGLEVITLQTPLLFERESKSKGHYNNCVMIVDFKEDGTFRKTEY